MWWKALKIAGYVLVGGALIAVAIFVPPLGVIGVGAAATAFTVSLSATAGAVIVGGIVHTAYQGAAPPDPDLIDLGGAGQRAHDAADRELLNIEENAAQVINAADVNVRLRALEAEAAAERAENAALRVQLNAERQANAEQLNRIERSLNDGFDGVRQAGLFRRRGSPGGGAAAANQPADPASAAGFNNG